MTSPQNLGFFDSVKAFSIAEDERYAPDACKRNDRINDPAYDRHRASAYPRDYIKIEKSYASPVESSDHRENKCYSVNYHHGFIPSGL